LEHALDAALILGGGILAGSGVAALSRGTSAGIERTIKDHERRQHRLFVRLNYRRGFSRESARSKLLAATFGQVIIGVVLVIIGLAGVIGIF